MAPPPTKPANADVGSLKLASSKVAPAPISSRPVCTTSVPASKVPPPRPLPAALTVRLLLVSLPSLNKSLAGPTLARPRVRASAPNSAIPAAVPYLVTLIRSTSSLVLPSSSALSTAPPYVYPSSVPIACPARPVYSPLLVAFGSTSASLA